MVVKMEKNKYDLYIKLNLKEKGWMKMLEKVKKRGS